MNEEMMISGVWVNKQTGEKIQIMNNIIDGDQMILVTDKGTIDMNEFSANYIQCSDEEYDESGNVKGTSSINVAEMIKDVNEHKQSAYMNVNNTYIETPQNKQETKQTQENKILEKFFNKIQNKENLITFEINFDNLPINDLQTIIDYMDIDKTEIAQYIANKLLNKKYIEDAIVSKLNEKLK